jgi:excisionase family DNA binding protein
MSENEIEIILEELRDLKLTILKLREDPVPCWLDVRGVAEYLGCSTSKIYKLVEARKIPHNRIAGGTLRFSRKSIDNWLERREIKTASRRAGEIASGSS